MKRLLLIINIVLLSCNLMAQTMNHPLSDDKLMHYGGFVGVNFPSYIIDFDESKADVIQPKIGYGLVIGGYVDVRLCRYLNLKLSPSINFNTANIQKIQQIQKTQQTDTNQTELLTMPISIPLELKWSAEREKNYRPFVIVGGGVSFDMNHTDEGKKIFTKAINYFVEGGFGCDFYTKWFRCSPEIKYQIGFNDMCMPKDEWGNEGYGWAPDDNDYSYIDSIERLLFHQISLIINFGSL